MYTRLIGDIHGLFKDYKFYSLGIGRQLKKTEHYENSIQIGDFGFGFRDTWDNNVKTWQAENPTHRFIRGNHDNPAVCKTSSAYIPDGRIEGHTMYLGGAWSIDNPNADPGWHKRTEGVDWWADEECSEAQFQQFLGVYEVVRPRVMITHDCPTIAAKRMFFDSGFIKGTQYETRTSTALQRMYDIHQPDVHIFGHYHKTMLHIEGRTYFMCLGELDYLDVDLEDIEQMQQAMIDKVTSSW